MELLLLVFLPCILWKMEFHKTAFHADAMSLEKTGAVKGILAVLIILHHLSRSLEKGGPLGLLLDNVGVLCVALFFFFSGYGLQKSYHGKPNYRAAILRKRIPSVLVPYVFLILLYWFLSWMVSEPYSLGEVLASLVNGKPIVSFSWYTLCILMFYVNYFLSTLLFRRRNGGILWYNAVCTVLWVFLCRRLGYAEYWYNAAIAFPLGIFWGEYGEKRIPWLRKHHLPALIISFGVFGIFYSAALVALKTDVFVSLYWMACVGFLLFVVL
ncbi:MAG: acyltransferase family protein, partial [Anaerotignum sp.]|nr:acyltransferase family protein [Anaerotignum sp.]